MITEAPLWLKVFQALLPTMVAAIVGGFTIWIGTRQMNKTAELALRQMELTARLANEQIAGHLSAAHLAYRAQVLSANRQAWINDVRNVVADMVAILERYRQTMNEPGLTWDHIERFDLNRNRLRLLLNPSEPPSQAIMVAAGQLQALAYKQLQPDDEYHSAVERILSGTAVVLKQEWERVKRGE